MGILLYPDKEIITHGSANVGLNVSILTFHRIFSVIDQNLLNNIESNGFAFFHCKNPFLKLLRIVLF